MPGIDIYNLEPEAYGAVVEQPCGENIPAIGKHPFDSVESLLELPPLDPARDGRIPMAIEAAQRLRQTFPGADIRVPISGPFSIASNLLGFDKLLYTTALEPELAAAALMHLVEGQVRFARAVKAAGVDVAFFESAACPPMLSPALFQTVELPALSEIMRRIGDAAGHPIPCIIGGNTCAIVEMMLSTGTGYLVCPFETDQPAFLEKVWNCTEVRIRVNIDLRVLAQGPWERIRAEAERVIRLVQGRPNVCLGTGALSYETPPENVLKLIDYVQRFRPE